MSTQTPIPAHLCTTFQRLRDAQACTDGYGKLANYIRNQFAATPKDYGMTRPIPLAIVLTSNGLADALWVLRNAHCGDGNAERDRFIRLLACDFVEHVLPIFEERYPDDKRPHEAIRVARLLAEGKATDAELIAARQGGVAAAAAAAAAVDAAYATYSAAASAASAAAYTDAAYAAAAADAATYAAAVAATDAAAAAEAATDAASAAEAATDAAADAAAEAATDAAAAAEAEAAVRKAERQWQVDHFMAAMDAEAGLCATTLSEGSAEGCEVAA